MATHKRDFRTFLLVAQFEADQIGTRIAQARLEAGLTQEQLAEIAPFSKRSLQDYETGKTIPYRHLRDIGRLLNRPIDWFLHGDQPPVPAVDPERFEALLGRLERLIELLEADREAAARGG